MSLPATLTMPVLPGKYVPGLGRVTDVGWWWDGRWYWLLNERGWKLYPASVVERAYREAK